MNTVLCPNCKHPVEISEAITHQIEEEVLSLERRKFKKELEKALQESEKKAEIRIKDELEFKLKDSQNEIEETRKNNKELQEKLLGMTRSMREISKRDEERQLEMEKKIGEIAEKARDEVRLKFEEEHKLRDLEKDKKIQDMLDQIEELKRKGQQGSMQTQGEVLELDFEVLLKQKFPFDNILPVPKGINGADILQRVQLPTGRLCGTIIWETKRTKNFAKDWLPKLREDKRLAEANIGVLVTETLPEGIRHFGLVDGIWVTSYIYVEALAQILRLNIIEVFNQKAASNGKDEKLDYLYEYLTSHQFKNRIEAIVESFVELQTDLDKEKRALAAIWKKREMQIRRLAGNTANLYGEMKGIIGAALPQVQGLDITQLSAGDEKDSPQTLF